MSDTPKIVSIGAAVQDVFLQGDAFRPHKDGRDFVETFKLGSKQNVEQLTFSTGGGATNAAVTFAKAGLQSCFMGKVGHDIAGTAVLDELHKSEIDTSLVKFSDDGTGYSVVLLAPSGERTILTYRGASDAHDLHTYNFAHVTADWFYISTLDGNFNALEAIFDYATEHNIKVAINPGAKELARPERLKQLLSKATVLCLNKEEMQHLFKARGLEELVRMGNYLCQYVVVTDGPNGLMACDGHSLVEAGMYEDVPVVDRTGAGDAFASGFTAMIALGESLSRAVVYGSANSTNVVTKIGAKAGIISHGKRLHQMPLQVRLRDQ